MTKKLILDACCGNRMFWINKTRKDTIYMDKRKKVKPDIIANFKKIPFKNNTFHLVIFDPPHIIEKNPLGIMNEVYGTLNPKTWEKDLKKGFKECMRVLKKNGILIFKWAEINRWGQQKHNASLKDLIKLFEKEPLIAQKTRGSSNGKYSTHWITYIK